jgi:hypothetical protein
MTKAYKALPPKEVIWETFDYKPLTGELIRRLTSAHTRPDCANKAAGSIHKATQYRVISVKSKPYYAHRLVTLWVTGIDPTDKQIDHVNMNKSDNRWFNLRLATKSENMRNRYVRGAYHTPWGWASKIMVNYKSIHLGYFPTKAEAAEAYAIAALKYHGKFARTQP